MNSIILMAEVLTEPELRYTPDNQNAIASFLAQFASARPEDSPYRIKVVGWNNLANEVMEKYHKGDRIVIEGRLRIDSIDKGTYKEKRTEITAQRIYELGDTAFSASTTSSSAATATATVSSTSSKVSSTSKASTPKVPVASDPQYDDIPF